MVRKLILLAVVAFLASPAAAAVPDRCVWATHAEGASADGKARVEIRYDEEHHKWTFACSRQEVQVANGEIPGLQAHAHPRVFVNAQGERFVIYDPEATTRSNDRILIYDFAGTLQKSLSVSDVLTEQELTKVGKTRSHLMWTAADEEHGRGWLADDGKSFQFRAAGGGRLVSVPLYAE